MAFIKKNKAIILTIILFALFVRVSVILFLEPDRPVDSDGTYYLETAINLSNGKGYTWDGENPFFFREPGVIYFYAGCLKTFKLIHDIDYIEKSDSSFEYYMYHYKNKTIRDALRFIRIIQAFLQILTISLFYFLLKRHVSKTVALATLIFLSLFPPYFFYVFSILREPLAGFLIMLFVYTLDQYRESGKKWIAITLGILWGLAALTFQVYIILGGVFLVYVAWENRKVLQKIIKPSLLLLAGFSVTVIPWLIKVYNYYPDLRIVKTLGISLTYEHKDFIYALTHCDDTTATGKFGYNLSSTDPENRYIVSSWYGETSQEHFRKSFDGTYKRDAEFLKSATSPEYKRWRFLRDLERSVKQSFFRFGTENQIQVHFGHFAIWKASFYLIGLLALTGLFLHFKLILPVSMTYLAHIVLFWLIGTEARRMLPIHPFMIFFAILSLNYLLLKIRMQKRNVRI